MPRFLRHWAHPAPMHLQIADAGCDDPASHGPMSHGPEFDDWANAARRETGAAGRERRWREAVARVFERRRFRAGRRLQRWTCLLETMQRRGNGATGAALSLRGR